MDRGKKLKEAEALIRRALAVEPDNHYYQDSLGWACYKQGRYDEAKDALSKACPGRGPSASEEAWIVFEHLAKVYEKLGDAKERPEQLRQGQKSGSSSPQTVMLEKSMPPKKTAFKLQAPAKINFSLEVLGKRQDGFHEVRMLMAGISLCDELSFEEWPELRAGMRASQTWTAGLPTSSSRPPSCCRKRPGGLRARASMLWTSASPSARAWLEAAPTRRPPSWGSTSSGT